MTTKSKTTKIKKFLEERDGKDVKVVDLKKSSNVCDYFVIATFESPTVLRSTVRDLWEELQSLDIVVNDRHKEVSNDGWYLIDCGEILIHLFSEEMREFYSLEKLWDGYIKQKGEQIEG